MTTAEDLKRHVPTTTNERLVALDALRGVALFGIMFVNMTWFTGFAVIFGMTPEKIEALGTLAVDTRVNWLVTLLVDSKFWSIFALLFGVGLGMQLMKLHSLAQSNGLLVRRLLVLFVVGMLHGVFIWFGDIISLYAVTGFFLLLFGRFSNTTILRFAVFFLFLPVIQAGIWLLIYGQLQHDSGWVPNLGHGPVEMLPRFATGNWADTFEANWVYFAKRWIRAIYEGRLYKILGMLLLGYFAVRLKLFSNVDKYRKEISGIAILGLSIGLPLNWIYANTGGGIILPMDFNQWLLVANQSIAIPVLSCGYFALILLLFSWCPRLNLWVVFANVGRMSLTNYIIQSVVGVVGFYGCCFGMWGAIGITWSLPLIVVVFLVQSAFSSWWLSRFRWGPFEWICRSMTYGSILSIRHSPDSP